MSEILSEILSEIFSFLPLCSKMPEFGSEPNGSQTSEIFRHSDVRGGTCSPAPPPPPLGHDAYVHAIAASMGGLGDASQPVIAKIDFPMRRNPNRKWSGGGSWGGPSCEM